MLRLFTENEDNKGTVLWADPVLVDNIHDGHQLASMPPEGDESDSADLDEAFEHLRAERLARVGTQRLHEQLPVPSLAHRPQARSHPPGEKCSRKAAWRGRGTPKPPLINLSPHQSQPNGHARPAPTHVRRPAPRPAPRPAQRPAPARPRRRARSREASTGRRKRAGKTRGGPAATRPRRRSRGHTPAP